MKAKTYKQLFKEAVLTEAEGIMSTPVVPGTFIYDKDGTYEVTKVDGKKVTIKDAKGKAKTIPANVIGTQYQVSDATPS